MLAMDRATKLAVLGWVCAAVALQTWLTPGWRELELLTAAAFVVAALLTAFKPGLVAAVLVFTYVFPALIRLSQGTYHVSYDVLWMSALLGAITPQTVRTPWHLPGRWRAPLVCWALIIATSATIVACREVDFNVALLTESRMPSEILNGVPRFTVGWVLHVALNLLIGILWFDWLFGAKVDFRRSVVAPLAASCAVMLAVAVYQLFVDVWFLNETVYGGLGRAGGTVFDGNAMGTIAAMWIGGLVLYVRELKSWRSLVLGVGISAAWMAVWASQSRSGFAAAVIVTGFVLIDSGITHVDVARRFSRRWPILLLPAIGMILLAMISAVAGGPIERFRRLVSSTGSLTNLLAELWNRNEYGQYAVRMITDHPLFGVGAGSFHLLVTDYARLSGSWIPSDNAQNWYRHQLAEFGLVGSVAWILWVVVFAAFVLRRSNPAVSQPGTRIVRGMLVAFALVSLVGMPSQVVSVVMTFWTMAFWFVWMAGDSPPATSIRARTWALIAIVCLVYGLGTIRLASTDLRVPARAERLGRSYAYGFYHPEPDGAGGEQRWARRRAAILIPASTRWLELTLGVNHADIDTEPVKAKVWLDGRVVLDTVLRSTTPVTQPISISADRRQVLLETWVSRVVRPRDFGVADDRELGLLVKWAFLDRAPAP